jgi:hypothetical protein
MTALLGLLAIADYQNRDKIAEMLGGLGQNKPGGQGGIIVLTQSDGPTGPPCVPGNPGSKGA